MSKRECDWCAGSKQRLNTSTRKWEKCERCPKTYKHEVEEVVDVAKKYAHKVRVGKTARDHSRKHHKVEA